MHRQKFRQELFKNQTWIIIALHCPTWYPPYTFLSSTLVVAGAIENRIIKFLTDMIQYLENFKRILNNLVCELIFQLEVSWTLSIDQVFFHENFKLRCITKCYGRLKDILWKQSSH